MLNHALPAPAPAPGRGSTERGSSSQPRRRPTATGTGQRGGIVGRQVQRLILEILTDAGTDEQVRFSLLRHLAEYRGDPAGAMLAHLHEMADRDERAGRNGG
jgi:hypothetical protein